MTFHYDNPYASTRHPVFARNLVAASHPLAAQAGLRMLQEGGNAADAAVAAAAAMTICEPVSNGLGSDAFCILWDGKQLHGLNAAGRAPAKWSVDYFQKKYGDADAPPKRGIDSVTVPGAVAAWVQLNKRFGRLPLADVLAPAIDIAERGYLVPVVVGRKWAAAVPELQSQPGFGDIFMPRGRAPQVGELFQFPAAAQALKRIAASRGVAFYGGEIAHAIERFAAAQGGVIEASDFERYQPEWVETISMSYRGYQLHEIGPSTQGIAALMALGMLDHFDLRALGVGSVSSKHVQIEAMKLAFADVYRHVAEPSSMGVDATQMLDESYLKSRARLIRMNKAQDFGPGLQQGGGTIYLTAADENGMMVSFIQSNYQGFGSGCVEPEFGISLQNRGHGFSLQESSPNVVAPGKRPFHTIIPAFLTRDGQPVMSFGVMGAHMQPQGHVQALVRMLDQDLNPQAACDAPRWRVNPDGTLNVEASANPAVVQELKDRGHRIEALADSYQDFGAGQFIWRLGDPKVEGYVGASDARRDGLVAGF
ncbi:MAG: gamma-glutamyltransferase family protein [Pseudomonadota bacterium]|nr:gamma-glutamyltransferase family protein [Pseudomonadota bacterium]